jgi:AAA ATPase domain
MVSSDRSWHFFGTRQNAGRIRQKSSGKWSRSSTLRENAPVSPFVGRADALAQLLVVSDEVLHARGAEGGSARVPLVLVTGEAGMGKTSLLQRYAAEVADRGARAVWGTCWEGDQAPALWPWTQVVRTLLDQDRDEEAVTAELAVVVPERAAPPGATTAVAGDTGRLQLFDEGGAGEADRLRVFDAVGRLLAGAAARQPTVVLLDDLQWSDRSTVDLMRFLVGMAYRRPPIVIGAYRPNELRGDVVAALAALSEIAQPVPLPGLSPAEVNELVAALAGEPTAARWGAVVAARSEGHPFFARELTYVLAAGGGVAGVPAAIRELVARRLARLTSDCVRLLETCAVAGAHAQPDVLADATGQEPSRVADLVEEAVDGGVLTHAANTDLAGALAESVRFGHDLYRESIYASLARTQRVELHRQVGEALVRRHVRGAAVFPAELARHFAASAAVTGTEPALAWARRAAAADEARFAYADAAGHLARARLAMEDAGLSLSDADLVDLLTAEADARLRAGAAGAAHALLDTAWERTAASDDAERMGAVALGLDRIGARFAMPRGDLVAVLERAREAAAGAGTLIEAQVTAALARQLAHSVARDRPRARPLADRAVELARDLDDPITLASCLLAQHDSIWTPGTAADRVGIAREIALLAERAGDQERQAQGLLLTATAQLELGSPAFQATMTEYSYVTERLRQPRHDYLLRTRRAALALLHGDIDGGDRLSAEAERLGEEVGDSDAGNVRMSQLLEVVRARGDPGALRHTAGLAVEWWVGVPTHAHAVAAGFLARAGDVDGARRELDVVLSLADWRAERSYLWSMFVGELVEAAVAVADNPLCERLLDDLMPVADRCAVGGALVCFMGAHAHRVGRLHAALGRVDVARDWFQRALGTHVKLGARAWEAETCAALAGVGGSGADGYAARGRAIAAELGLPGVTARMSAPLIATPTAGSVASLRRVGDMWEVGYGERTAYVRDVKGLHDLAALLARPGVEIPAIDLAGATGGPRQPEVAGQTLDRAALAAYRRRLVELVDDLADAELNNDIGRAGQARNEREWIVAELRRSTRPGGSARALGVTTSERARKAVTARIRDAIHRIAEAMPELGVHLDRSVRTGNTCRYDP